MPITIRFAVDADHRVTSCHAAASRSPDHGLTWQMPPTSEVPLLSSSSDRATRLLPLRRSLG